MKIISISIILIINIFKVLCLSDRELLAQYLKDVIKNSDDAYISTFLLKQVNFNKDDTVFELIMNFKDNSKQFLPMSKFPKLSNLRIIKFKDVYFENDEFPIELFDLPNLTHIEIRNTQIKKIPSIPSNEKVDTILLNTNNLNAFPIQFKSLKNLTNLNLNNNNITSVSKEILDFPNLNQLKINNNLLSGELYVSESMNVIDASNNKLNSLTINCTDCNLTELNLSNNKLKDIQPDFLKELTKLEILDISNNDQLQVQIIHFKEGKDNINKCNFENTKISCLQKSACHTIIPENIDTKECPIELINQYKKEDSPKNLKGDNNPNNNNNNNTLTILTVSVVILLAIVGFLWMYKTNQQRKQSREADIIISPTVKNENYYKELLNKENDEDNNNQNKSFNNYNDAQTSFNNSFANIKEPTSPMSRILPESLTSPSSNSYPQRSFSDNQSSDETSMNNNLIRSTTLNENNSSTVSPSTVNPLMRSSTLPVSRNINRNQMMRSPTAPSTTPSTTPIAVPATAQTTTISTMDKEAISNTSMEMSSSMINPIFGLQNVTNPLLQGNGMNPLQVPTSAYINPNISNNFINGITNMNVQTPIALYQMNINGMYNYSNFAGSSSSSNNNYINQNLNEINSQDIDDIKLKKKILKEKMNLEKLNLNQNNNNQNDPDNNLPPYSEL